MSAIDVHEKSEEQDSKAYFVLLHGKEESSSDLGRRYGIPEQGIVVGGAEESGIFLQGHGENTKIRIFLKKGDWYLQDVTKLSKVTINDIPSMIACLSDGDIIKTDPYVFEFYLGDGAKAAFYKEIYSSLREDILTKAYNRRVLMDLLQWELTRYQQWQDNRRSVKQQSLPPPMSLLMLDIDKFGQINKQFDHKVGDEVLKSVVRRVKERVRSTDIVARYGGEEFFVYLPDTNYEQGMELAEQIRLKIAGDPFSIPRRSELISVSVSIGVVQYHPDMDVDTFTLIANQRMLLAKDRGRNRVVGQD